TTEFDNMKAIFYKVTNVKIRELIETLKKYIEKYGENFINYLLKDLK
ncbi:12149_t:CDS:1, partial [Gigaspora rosea]